MRKIRLCIGSNDGETIANTHMGDTEQFHIYELFENSEYQFVETRTNTVQEMEHGKEDKMRAIIELVKDTDVFVARQKSLNFARIAKGTKYQPVIVKSGKIAEALMVLGNAFEDIVPYIERRRSGETFDNIPEFG